MCLQSIQFNCIPKFPNLPFPSSAAFKKWIFMKINTSYTMKKRSGMNLTLPGAQSLMDLHGHHSPPKSYRQPDQILPFSTIEIFVSFHRSLSTCYLRHHHPFPTRSRRTFHSPPTHGTNDREWAFIL